MRYTNKPSVKRKKSLLLWRREGEPKRAIEADFPQNPIRAYRQYGFRGRCTKRWGEN